MCSGLAEGRALGVGGTRVRLGAGPWSGRVEGEAGARNRKNAGGGGISARLGLVCLREAEGGARAEHSREAGRGGGSAAAG